MLSATQIGNYTKYTLIKTESYHASYLACTKCYSGQLALSLIATAMGRGVLILQVMTLMSLCETYYVVESAFG